MRERSIRKTLKELNVFKGLNDSDLEWSIQSENIENTVHVIDSVMQEYFSVIKYYILYIIYYILLYIIAFCNINNIIYR